MDLTVERFVLEPLYQANCWVLRRGDEGAVVIDPGGDPSPLDGVAVAAILVTHGDVDHIGGVAELAERTGAEVWMPAGEVDALRAGETRGGARVRPHEPEHLVRGGDVVRAGGLELDVLDVPGHSSGHVAFHVDGRIFSGDLVFEQSVGRVDLVGGDWQTLLDSISSLLERFGPDAVVYPGHGGPTTLGRELETNPFLHELRAAR